MAVDKGRLVLALNHLLIVQLFNLPCKSSGTCLGCLAWATHKYFFSLSVQMTRAIVSCWHAPWSNHMLKYHETHKTSQAATHRRGSVLWQHQGATKWTVFEEVDAVWAGESFWNAALAGSYRELQILPAAFFDFIFMMGSNHCFVSAFSSSFPSAPNCNFFLTKPFSIYSHMGIRL